MQTQKVQLNGGVTLKKDFSCLSFSEPLTHTFFSFFQKSIDFLEILFDSGVQMSKPCRNSLGFSSNDFPVATFQIFKVMLVLLKTSAAFRDARHEFTHVTPL